MLYKELKPVLADKVVEVVLVKGALPTAHYKIESTSKERGLLNSILGNDPLSKLDNFDVKAVYATQAGGFTLEFETSEELIQVCRGLGELFLRA